MSAIIPPTKRCTKCGVEYPATEEYFYRTGNGDHLRRSCKRCKYEYDHAIRQTPEHKERRKTWDTKYNQSDKGRAFQHKRTRTEHYHLYRRSLSKLPKYRALSVVSQQNRKSRMKSAAGHFNVKDIKKQYNSQKGLCWWCDKPLHNRYEVDHRIPLAKGGTNWPNNLCLTCPSCNRSKNDKMPWEYNGRLL